MSARARALAAAFALLAPCAAAAQEAPPVPGELPKAPSTPYVLSGARFLEVNVTVATLLDVNGRTDAPKDTRVGRSSALLGFDFGLPLWNQRIRPSVFGGVQLGYWGDDAHGPVSAYAGARLRASFWMGDLWDFYAVARGDFPMTGAGVGFRPGLGLGMRVGRAVSLEGTYDMLVPLGGDFQNTQYGSLVPVGMTIALSVDACIGCTRSEKPQLNRDLACRLYDFAKDASTCGVRDAICAAVPKALAACPNPLVAARDDDGTSTFLAALEDAVAPLGKPAVQRLRALHAALVRQWEAYEASTTSAALEKRKLSERWTYAPVPGELRAYLGCDGPVPPDCAEITAQ